MEIIESNKGLFFFHTHTHVLNLEIIIHHILFFDHLHNG